MIIRSRHGCNQMKYLGWGKSDCTMLLYLTITVSVMKITARKRSEQHLQMLR